MAYKKDNDAKKANEMAIAELKRRIKDGGTGGVYVFTGDEEYMKRYYFTELCRDAGESVNITTLRGEMDFGKLCDELSCVPMQEFSLFDAVGEEAGKRIIKLDSPDFSKLSEREMSEVYEMLADVSELSVVVIYFSNIEPAKGKGNTAIIKKLSENALVCNFERAEPGDASLLRWIKKHFDNEKIIVNPEDVRYLPLCVGTDMCLLSFEIEKLTAYLSHNGRQNLTREDIDYICIKNTEAITFDVTNAITARDFDAAISALSRLRTNKTEPLLIFGAITKTAGDLCTVAQLTAAGRSPAEIVQMSGMRDFVVRRYMSLLRELPRDYAERFAKRCLAADEKLKRGADGYLVLENLLFEIIS